LIIDFQLLILSSRRDFGLSIGNRRSKNRQWKAPRC